MFEPKKSCALFWSLIRSKIPGEVSSKSVDRVSSALKIKTAFFSFSYSLVQLLIGIFFQLRSDLADAYGDNLTAIGSSKTDSQWKELLLLVNLLILIISLLALKVTCIARILTYMIFVLIAIDFSLDMDNTGFSSMMPQSFLIFIFQAFYCDFIKDLTIFSLIFGVQQIVYPKFIMKQEDWIFPTIPMGILLMNILLAIIFHLSVMYVGLYCYKMDQKINCHKLLLNRFQDCLVVTDKLSEKIIFANKSAKKLFREFTPSQTKEKKDLSKVDLEKIHFDRVSTCNLIDSISSIENETFSLGQLLKKLHKAGTEFEKQSLQSQIYKVQDSNQEPRFFSIEIQDIEYDEQQACAVFFVDKTGHIQLKQKEISNQKLTKQLQEARGMLKQVVIESSHQIELVNEAFCDLKRMLQSSLEDVKFTKVVKVMMYIQYMIKLEIQLLDRMNSPILSPEDKFNRDLQRFDPNFIIQKITDIMKLKLMRYKTKIQCDFVEDFDSQNSNTTTSYKKIKLSSNASHAPSLNHKYNVPELIGDVLRLQQVLVILIDETLKSIKKDGCRIKIITSHSDSNNLHVLIKVEGNEDKYNGFLEIQSKENQKGLGLQICQKIIGQNNGVLDSRSLISRNIKTSKFTMRMPRVDILPLGVQAAHTFVSNQDLLIGNPMGSNIQSTVNQFSYTGGVNKSGSQYTLNSSVVSLNNIGFSNKEDSSSKYYEEDDYQSHNSQKFSRDQVKVKTIQSQKQDRENFMQISKECPSLFKSEQQSKHDEMSSLEMKIKSKKPTELQVLVILPQREESDPISECLKQCEVKYEVVYSVYNATGLIAYTKLNNGPMHNLLIIHLQEKASVQRDKLESMMELILLSYDKSKKKKPYVCLVSKKTHDNEKLIQSAKEVGIDQVLFEPIELKHIKTLLNEVNYT